MKLRIALTGLFILAAVLGEVIAVEEIGAVEEKLFSHKYALLIGVEDYPGTGNDLDYCLDDLYDMQEALINFCNFSISDIRILTDSNATKSNIQSAIDWLAANADNNDTVMFFYSGHGMSSGKLAQYDYSTQGGITSAELDSWLDSVNSSIIVVLDCCFAGAFTSKLHNRNHFSRDFTLKSMLRSLSKNAKCVFENTKERSNFVRGLAQEGRIICAACDENEYSWEFDELRNGAFSYYFTQALQSLKSDVNKNDWVSCEEAFEDAKPKVKEFVKIYANDTQIPKIYDGIPNEVDLVFFNVSKDIMVTTPTIIENKNLLLRGNLTVLSQLELSNTTLVLLPSYDGEFQIGVEPETALHIHNSTITSWDYNKHYLFYVKNASFKIENSSLQYCGYSREKIGLNIKNCTYIQIKNSSFSDSFFGLSFESCTNINIDSCDIIRNNDYGLILTNCTNADINNSRILNDEINICLANSSNISIWNCTISKGNYGIWFFYSSGNRIAQSNISDNYHGGVRLYEHSTNNTLAECLVCNNEYGIWLDSSSNNLLTCNTLNNNLYNFVVSGNEIFDFHQNIDTTNTINGKPMYYIVGESNRVFNETLYAGYLGLISCNNITVKKLELANNTHGLLLVNTSQSTIAENKIFSNYWYGIYLWNSPDNNISANQIYNNYYGIYLCSSSCNVIANCSIYNNLGYGIYICRDSINNLIYRNNFINNSYQAYDECNNYWDDGKIGNYWSDFYSEDLDSDGICDNPYIISGGNNKDTNPLFEPVGIDSIWPRIVISGVANNTCYNSTVVPIIDIWDINLNLSLITLNGESFVSGRPINR
ncbi:MAG: NosD domain-containing protein, partial [Candidatus Thermoplasmatota archaeon]